MSTDAKLLFFKLQTCPNCPRMERVTERVADELSLGFESFYADQIPQQIIDTLYRDNITITAAPSVVLKSSGRLYPITFGDVITEGKLQQKVEKYVNGHSHTDERQQLSNSTLIDIADLLPEVRTTKGNIVPFDQEKIIQSIAKETELPTKTARMITRKVMMRIIQSNIKWLSGPLIRTLCCAEMATMELVEARKRYARLGMPLMDYEALLNQGILENANQYNNPESIHSWAADRIASEYALLRILTEEQSKAHLRGDIHIHMLRYFDLRPFCIDGSVRIPTIKDNCVMNIEAKEFDTLFDLLGMPQDDVKTTIEPDEDIFFMTPSGPRRVKYITRRQSDPEMYKIRTNRGKEIILTQDHGVMI